MMAEVNVNYVSQKIGYRCLGCSMTYGVKHDECPKCSAMTEEIRNRNFLIQMIKNWKLMEERAFFHSYMDLLPHKNMLKAKHNMFRLTKKYKIASIEVGFPLIELK